MRAARFGGFVTLRRGAIGFAFTILAVGLHAQEPQLRISVDSTLVSLDAVVVGASGQPVTNLTQADFTIYEDGEPQSITHFAAADSPRSTLLLMDVVYAGEPLLIDAVNAFRRTLRAPDRLLVAAFDRDVRVALNWQGGQSAREANVRMPKFPTRAEMQATTRFYGSLEEAVRLFRNEQGRKGILVLTAGRDTEVDSQTLRLGQPLEISADPDFGKHLRVLSDAQIPIYIAALGTDRNGGGLHPSWFWSDDAKSKFLVGVRARMEKLAEVTGGRIFIPAKIEDVVPLYGKIGLELGRSYGLSYMPKSDQRGVKAHRIEVRVRGEGLMVSPSRTEYSTP
jgi:VWFA-related protein